MTVTVVKLGGSLTSSDYFQDWLDALTAHAQQSPVVIVPGGGEFADAVRQQQSQLGFNDLTAHRLALLAMCQMGYYLLEQCPALLPVQHSRDIAAHLDAGMPMLWLPMELLQDTDALPPSWDYTSDSIALWLSGRIENSRLLLVKRRLASSNTLIDYINNGIIDKGFQLLKESIKSKSYVLSDAQFTDLPHLPAPLT